MGGLGQRLWKASSSPLDACHWTDIHTDTWSLDPLWAQTSFSLTIQTLSTHLPSAQRVRAVFSLSFWLLGCAGMFLYTSQLVQWSRICCQCRRHKRLRLETWVRKIPWSKKWQPTPVFLPGESHGQRSLTVHGVAMSQTQLKRLSIHIYISLWRG